MKLKHLFLLTILTISISFVSISCSDDNDSEVDGDTEGTTENDADSDNLEQDNNTEKDVENASETEQEQVETETDAEASETETDTEMQMADFGLAADEWEVGEKDVLEMVFTSQLAFNEIVSDEEILTTLDGTRSGQTRETTFSSCREIVTNVSEPRFVVNYDKCSKAAGDIHISREGDVGDKYYLVDFQDNFNFLGLDIDGKIEIRKIDTLKKEYGLKILKNSNNILSVGRDKSSRHFKLILALAATLIVKNDTIGVKIANDLAKSFITGDSTWKDVDAQLGDKKFALLTGETNPAELMFPRKQDTCLCPNDGPMYLSGVFDVVKLAFQDKNDGIKSYLNDRKFASNIIEAFKNFEFKFEENLHGMIGFDFSTVCGKPATVYDDLSDLLIPLKSSNTECKLSGNGSVMTAVDGVLSNISSLGDTEKTAVRAAIENFLSKHTNDKGCFKLDKDILEAAAKEKLDTVFDWNICKVN